MNTRRTFSLASLLAGIALAGCQDGGPLQPSPDTLALEEELTLELLGDPASAETALEIAGVQTRAAHGRGYAWRQSEEFAAQARLAFRNAQSALARGDGTGAMEQAGQARRLLVRAMEGAGGPMFLDALVEHLASLPLLVAGDPGAFDDPGGLGMMLGQLARESGKAHRAGNRMRAGELGILGEQLFRQRQWSGALTPADRADLIVALGAEAVDLATELLADQDADSEQQDLLATAVEFQAQAEEALSAGETARAAHLARLAEWWSLKAVVLPDGVTDEEIQQLVELATGLVNEATTTLGDDPGSLEAILLAKAQAMLEMGIENTETASCRGTGALWQASVIASYLLGIA